MIFEFGGSPELASPREAVWRHLQDGDLMAACTPSTQSFEIRGPGRYSVTCSVGAGLVRAHVVLEAELHDFVHPESLRLRATGTAPGSTLDVETLVRLEALGPERTRLTWSSVTGVHGMLANFGRGMIEGVLRQFTERFWTNVAERVAAATVDGAVLLVDAEAEAAGILAAAAAGPGVVIGAVREGRVDLFAAHRGVLTISLEGVERIKAIGPLELITRWNHQPVEAGEVVASVKAAPHAGNRAALLEGARLAGEHAPLLMVRPYDSELPDPPAS